MPHINGCDWGHSVVTGSLKSFGCVRRVTKIFSTDHGQCCTEQSQRSFARTSNGAASV